MRVDPNQLAISELVAPSAVRGVPAHSCANSPWDTERLDGAFASGGDRRERICADSAEVAQFLDLLAQLIEGGVDLHSSLEALRGRGSPSWSRALSAQLLERLDRGYMPSQALWMGGRWGAPVCALIRAGEASGQLGEGLRSASHLLHEALNWRQQWRGQLAYPLFLLGFSLASFLFVWAIIAPQLAQMEASHPPHPSPRWSWLFFALIGVASTALALWRAPLARIAFAIPLWRASVADRQLHWFFRVFSQLLAHRIELPRAISLSLNALTCAAIKSRLAAAMSQIDGGYQLSAALAATQLLMDSELQLVKVGEDTNQLSAALNRVASGRDQRRQRRNQRFLAVLQPALLISVGAIIAAMALMILRPIHEIGDWLEQ